MPRHVQAWLISEQDLVGRLRACTHRQVKAVRLPMLDGMVPLSWL